MNKIHNNSVVYPLFRNAHKVIYRMHCSDLYTFEMTPDEWDTLQDAPKG